MGRPNNLESIGRLAEEKPHGTRMRYMAGCRCRHCRTANAEYMRTRARARREGDWNGLVPAPPARRHIKMLSQLGIGRIVLAKMCGIAQTTIQEIKSGTKRSIRKHTETAILSIARSCQTIGNQNRQPGPAR